MSQTKEFLMIYWSLFICFMWLWLYLETTIRLYQVAFKRKKIFEFEVLGYISHFGKGYWFLSHDAIPASQYEHYSPYRITFYGEIVGMFYDKFYPTTTIRPLNRNLYFHETLSKEFFCERKTCEISNESILSKREVTYTLRGIKE